ncbi:nuclear pore complex protein DDB_G0274915-like isoform X5 [Dreissena polymorpha]|uniref:nuclear pore complex protein DDB_G0274915-like isoform X5 n=1 Tax=Dreissena polymorpha TaxID=45954 RepID=UPI0022652C38|nr:nuclear pore complex protein DDB_G0274915-like isoform X5 [Dreissena polymorpha]
MIVYLFCAFSVLCALVLSFIYNNAGYILICVGFIIIYVCTDKVTRTEQCESDKFSRRHLNRNILKHKNNAKASSEESLRKSDQRKSQKSYERYLDFKAGLLSFSEKMWSSPNSKPRPKPRFSGNNPLNSSMPMHLSSPLTTRQRILENGSLDRSVLNSSVVNGLGTQNGHSGASSPLFSSPFMPQIKRALGLEPTGQNKYREPRRHSYGISAGGTTLDSSKVTGILPHVKLTPTRRLSLTERNSTMLNRGSTVKIAPPVAGKPLNSSLCQLRTEPFAADERPTPDTHAVVTALKERRKRSMNVHEENSDIPAQQAKRRRQESQHSNASTSSMPAMPDNLPDLSGTEFNMRLETPSIKRPSRPSQGEMDDLLSSPSVKRVCGEGRNNSILSSLSSSQRFLAAQSSKRKAETSFTEAQDGTSIKQQRNESSSQRGEPPKLTHIDYTPQKLEKVKKMLIEDNSEDVTFKQEDHANNSKENKELEEITTKPTLRNVPSMKKTASVYAGLSSRGSFRKAQYANVVATLDDYDTDREAEHERVQQMLKHVDESFTKKLEEKTTPVTTTVSVVVSTSLVPAVTTTVTIATAGVATTTSSTASILSHLEKLSKSPIQETGYLKAVFTSDGEPTKASLPPVSFKSLFPATTTSTGTLGTSLTTISGTQSTFTGFSGIQTTNMSAVTTASVPLSLGQATTSVASPGFKALFPTGSVQPIPLATSSTPASGFMFGASASSGLSFGSTSKTSSTAAPSLFQFGATSTAASSSTSTPAAGFTFGAPSGISAGSSAPFGASTTSSAAQSPFGAPVASSNTVASIFGTSSNSQMPFGTQTSNAATVFSFGANQKTTTAASIFTLSAGPTSSTAGASLFGSQPSSSSTAGFSFGVGGNQTATGFQFGNKPQTSSVFGAINAASPFGTTSSAAPAFGSTNQTQAFGLSNQTPAFGSTNQTPAFGSTNQTSAFGLTNQTLSFGSSNQTPAFGSSNQTAAFGSTNQTPAFGSTNQTPAFGSTSQAPAFGQSNSISGFGASSNPASVFGSGFAASTQKSNTPVFGASTNTASNSVFGNTGTPGFGKSQSMPAFGTSDSTLSGFNFGGPAPNVNPFGQGQTTPLKQTGSAFGMPSVDTTPKNQTGAMFQFGQSQNNNSSASKGFDFGAGASGSNTGGFNFTFSSSSMPGFNFMGTGATATPGLGTPGSFAVGTGDSAPRPPRAAASRANRRRPAVRK